VAFQGLVPLPLLRLVVSKAGQKPDERILYMAGLGDVAISASRRHRGGVIGVLRDSLGFAA
jgi:hypothetical protein